MKIPLMLRRSSLSLAILWFAVALHYLYLRNLVSLAR